VYAYCKLNVKVNGSIEVRNTPGGGFREANPPPPKAHSILRIFSCQIVDNFVYFAKVHEPLVKHEKNLGRSACLQSCQVIEIQVFEICNQIHGMQFVFGILFSF